MHDPAHSDSLMHDIAQMTSQHVLEVFAPLLREEERNEAFALVFERIRAGLECFEIQQNRLQKRLRPSGN